MKAFVFGLRCVLVSIFFSGSFGGALAADTNPPPRLTVELRDGSSVVGQAAESTFKFHSSLLGDLKLNVKNVRSIDCVKTNSAKLTAANGDVLSGWFGSPELRVITGFGKVELPVNSIRRASVSAAERGGLAREGLVALWSGEGNALDSVGANNGTMINSATFAAGEVGQAFSLSGPYNPCSRPGNGPCVLVPNSSVWAFGTNGFTIELWAKFGAPLPGCARQGYPYGGVFISNDEGGGSLNKWLFALDGPALDFHINGPAINGGSGVFLVRAPFTPNLNQWYHFAVTRDGNLYTIYVNGVAVGSQVDNNIIPDPNGPLTIGAAENMYFNGLLDEVGIYNRALSASEIQTICTEENNGEPLPPPTPTLP